MSGWQGGQEEEKIKGHEKIYKYVHCLHCGDFIDIYIYQICYMLIIPQIS
jgi:hypothetical protein